MYVNMYLAYRCDNLAKLSGMAKLVASIRYHRYRPAMRDDTNTPVSESYDLRDIERLRAEVGRLVSAAEACSSWVRGDLWLRCSPEQLEAAFGGGDATEIATEMYGGADPLVVSGYSVSLDGSVRIHSSVRSRSCTAVELELLRQAPASTRTVRLGGAS